jgi:GH15 family glucan-1,4-alpha-glucosidase
MDFLPADHPRVQSTIERLVESLSVNGLLYRFQPLETPGNEKIPMEQFEGAFLPVNFWLATAYAKSGRIEDAEHLLKRVEGLTNASGLFAEEADARSGEMVGNFPLLFSQVEYVRAVLAISTANEKIRPSYHSSYHGTRD